MMARMRVLLFLAVVFFVFPAMAGEDGALPCTLKNKEFCGKWASKDDIVRIMGNRLEWDEGYSFADCSTVKEDRFEGGRPLTLLKCIETPDTRYARNPNPYPAGYLLVMQPKLKWGLDDNWVKMFYFYREAGMTDPCFSGRRADKDSCDLNTFAVKSEKERGFYSLRGLD